MSEREDEAVNNLAELSAREKAEPIASFLEMRLVELSPGHAKVTMRMKPEYLTFNNLVFGGIIMSLVDQAFAYASNSLGIPTLASQFNIHFLASVGADDELTAECQIVKGGRRLGIYEMTATNQAGELIAKSTGTSISTH
ncbi:PaaI family thioesterase [Chloroflexota bacterium]